MCGQSLLGELDLCADCSRRPWSFTHLEGLVPYQSSSGDLLRAYKGRSRTALGWCWARLSLARLSPKAPLVCVPPHRGHLRDRGWDPVDFWARRLSRLADVPVLRVLNRRSTRSQKLLNLLERQANAQASFHLAPRAGRRLAGLPLVWLLDDVVTTGSTVEACTRLLLEAGVAEVRVLCLCLH